MRRATKRGVLWGGLDNEFVRTCHPLLLFSNSLVLADAAAAREAVAFSLPASPEVVTPRLA